MKLGAHVSVSGGFYKAIGNAEKIGAECFQIFGASPRTWAAKQPEEIQVKKFKQALKESSCGEIFKQIFFKFLIHVIVIARNPEFIEGRRGDLVEIVPGLLLRPGRIAMTL